MDAHLPVFAGGEVIRGFGRGSKDLGIPTANFPDEVVDKLPAEITTGIFFGWAQIDASPIYPMVVSIGKLEEDGITEKSCFGDEEDYVWGRCSFRRACFLIFFPLFT